MGQREHRVAPLVQVARDVAGLQRLGQRGARAGPVLVRACSCRSVVCTSSFSAAAPAPFGQLHRRVGVARLELLFHQAAHADEAGAVVRDQRLVGLRGQLRVPGHLGALRQHQLW
jgi:hypothetical protein